MNKIFFKFFLLLIMFTSCNDYQKMLRNEDTAAKYKAAEEYYENEESEWLKGNPISGT